MTRFRKILIFFSIVLLCASSLFSQQVGSSECTSIIRVSEYTEFLNCIAKTDTYGVYNPKMGENGESGIIITRSGDPGNYSYSCNPLKATLPITYVSQLSAIRYCNWKSQHGPVGLQDSKTTEAGAYDLTALDQGAEVSRFFLVPGATFFLPEKYLVDTTGQESSVQNNDPYLAFEHVGFCMATSTFNPSLTDTHNQSRTSLAPAETTLNGDSSLGNCSSLNGVYHSTFRESSFNNSFLNSTLVMGGVGPSSNTSQINIRLVEVGAPNNPPDTSGVAKNHAPLGSATGAGSVAMPYQIGAYDVTAEEYCAFLNAVAKKSDPHLLYNTNMSSDLDVACIVRSGDAASGYTYTTIKDREKFPITYVSWYAALRFCNWLENGQPTEGLPDTATEKGSYDLASASTFTNNMANLSPEALWSLPTDDQWHKAAYYQPAGDNKIPGSYCAFGTGSMNPPENQWAEATAVNGANYCFHGSFTTLKQPRITPVGSFSNSRSPWGAYDMAGEVSQWTSTFDATGNNIIIKGGAWNSESSDDLSSKAHLISTGAASPLIGFRVVCNRPSSSIVTHIDLMKDLVPIRDPNNPIDKSPDSISCGSVAKGYQISKYDVTAEQYCAFLNAVAAHSDPHHLYQSEMTSDTNVACIMRYGNTNVGFSYFPWPGREKFPITYVNWFSALRFCNWLENDQPLGDETIGVTESGSFNSDEAGVFTVSTNNPKWLLPTEDQWYKAAYYQPPQLGVAGFYAAFGTGSYQVPNNNLIDKTSTNSANYCTGRSFATLTAPYVTPVGTFESTKSAYGLYDMAGNVNQWTLTLSASASDKIVVRGGSWASQGYEDLRYSRFFVEEPTEANSVLGFRVVYNVEPAALQVPSFAQSFYKTIEFAGNTIWNDLKETPSKIISNTGEWFFNFIYYTIGVSVGEVLANIYNSLTYFLGALFSNIFQKITNCFGLQAGEWFSGWIKTIYDFLFSPIQSRRLPVLQAADRDMRSMQSYWLFCRGWLSNYIRERGGVIPTAEATTSQALPRMTTQLPNLSSMGEGELFAVAESQLAAADASAAAAASALTAESAAVGFFASPAAAIIIPLGLMVAGYEVLSYELESPNLNNDPRIGIGMLIDSIFRYVLPAIPLML